MEKLIAEHLVEVRPLLDQGEPDQVREALADLHPADVGKLIEALGDDHKQELFSALEPEKAAEVVVELSDYARDQVLSTLDTDQLTAILDDMPSDEATDIIADLPRAQADVILGGLDLEDSNEVRQLLTYDEESAGGIMQLEMAAVPSHWTLGHVIEAIRKDREELGELHNVFVVDRINRPVGVLPLAILILNPPETLVGKVMEPIPFLIQADEDQESVAHKFRHYDVVSAPVVDAEGRLLGRILIDDVMEVLEEEALEDFLRLSGRSAEEEPFQQGSTLRLASMRLPWLLANLGGGLLSGGLLWLFKVRMSDALFLLAFIPVIMAMAGNVGVQASTIIVRGFAVGEVTFANIWRILYKEVRVAGVIGVTCGILVGLVAHLWHGKAILGLVVGSSMTCAIATASLMGTLAPAAFKRLGVDPAISSGPVVTTVNDITGILIYFGFATASYSYLVA